MAIVPPPPGEKPSGLKPPVLPPWTKNAASDGGQLVYFSNKETGEKYLKENPELAKKIEVSKHADGSTMVAIKGEDGQKRIYKQLETDGGKNASWIQVDKDGKPIKDDKGNVDVKFTHGGFAGDEKKAPGLVTGAIAPTNKEEEALSKVGQNKLNPELNNDGRKDLVDKTLAKVKKDYGIDAKNVKTTSIGHSLGAGAAEESRYYAEKAGVNKASAILIAPFKGVEQRNSLLNKLKKENPAITKEDLSKNTTSVVSDSPLSMFMGENLGGVGNVVVAGTPAHGAGTISDALDKGKVAAIGAKGPGVGMPKLPGGMGAPGSNAAMPSLDLAKMVVAVLTSLIGGGELMGLFASLLEGMKMGGLNGVQQTAPDALGGPANVPRIPGKDGPAVVV